MKLEQVLELLGLVQLVKLAVCVWLVEQPLMSELRCRGQRVVGKVVNCALGKRIVELVRVA